MARYKDMNGVTVGIMGWIVYLLMIGWSVYGVAKLMALPEGPATPPFEASVLRQQICEDVRKGTIPDYQGEFDDECNWDYMKGAPREYRM